MGESPQNHEKQEVQQQRNTLPKVIQRDVVKQQKVEVEEKVEEPRAKEEERIQAEVKILKTEILEPVPSFDVGTRQSSWVPEGFGVVPVQTVEQEVKEPTRQTTSTEHYNEEGAVDKS